MFENVLDLMRHLYAVAAERPSNAVTRHQRFCNGHGSGFCDTIHPQNVGEPMFCGGKVFASVFRGSPCSVTYLSNELGRDHRSIMGWLKHWEPPAVIPQENSVIPETDTSPDVLAKRTI
jgi:hypothetical protein